MILHVIGALVIGSLALAPRGMLVPPCGSSPCPPDCPVGALLEGEADCYAGYYDTYNGGCDHDPRVFQQLPCDDDTLVVCGTYGNIESFDEDWYRFTITAFTTVDLRVEGEGKAQLALFGGTCDHPQVLGDMVADPCGSVGYQRWLAPGDYIVLVRPYLTTFLVPCGSRYRLEIHGIACPLGAQPVKWCALKSMYR